MPGVMNLRGTVVPVVDRISRGETISAEEEQRLFDATVGALAEVVKLVAEEGCCLDVSSGGELAFAPRQMHPALEGVEGDLAHHRVDHVLDLGGQHRLALHRVLGLLEKAAEGEHLAEDRSRLRERERRRAPMTRRRLAPGRRETAFLGCGDKGAQADPG